MNYSSCQHKSCLNILETAKEFIVTDGKLLASPIAMVNSMVPGKLQC